MRIRILVVLLALPVSLPAQAADAVVPQQIVGAMLPAVDIVDDSGRTRTTAEWKGRPTILVPIYTRCPSACLLTTFALKRAAFESSTKADDYRVVLFSFDSKDTPADLRDFRDRQRVPLSWTLATAGPDQVQRLMDAIGFRYAEAGGQLAHPSLAVALTPDLKTAKYLAGTNISGGDLDDALRIARGGRDWVGDYGGWALAVLVLTCTLSAVFIFLPAR